MDDVQQILNVEMKGKKKVQDDVYVGDESIEQGSASNDEAEIIDINSVQRRQKEKKKLLMTLKTIY